MSIDKDIDRIIYHLTQCDPQTVADAHLKQALLAVLEVLKQMRNVTRNLTSEGVTQFPENLTPKETHEQTSGPLCPFCGAFTTYARVRSQRGCMKCERERRAIQ